MNFRKLVFYRQFWRHRPGRIEDKVIDFAEILKAQNNKLTEINKDIEKIEQELKQVSEEKKEFNLPVIVDVRFKAYLLFY